MSENPFLSRAVHPPFDVMTADAVASGVGTAVERAEHELDQLVATEGPRTFENTLLALDALVERASRAFGYARHLTQVRSSPELRRAYNEALPAYSAFVASIPTHAGLWAALKAYAATDEARSLEGVRRRHLDKTLQEFRRAGADLPEAARERARALRVELSRLATRFSENVLDATNAYEMILTDEAELDGLPEGVRRRARHAAQAHGLEGYRFTLQAPSYRSFMKFATARDRRRQLYLAFTGRAAAGEHDNRPVLAAILRKRRELARLLGYRDFADLQLEDRMLTSGAQAQAFERDLARRTVPYFREEVRTLTEFAREHLGIERLEPWDLDFVAESLRRTRFDFDEEELRPYFPLDGVLDGLFQIAERLFGVRVEALEGVPTWHPEVRVYDLFDRDGVRVGTFYADWHPRESKRDGAWMNPMVTGGPAQVAGTDGAAAGTTAFVPHVGVIAANVTPPSGDQPALLTHDEVTTLFHEFGHLLHHVLGRVDVPARGSLGSVAWDFVELPSQLMENWAWEREGLDLFARHVETGARIPEDLYRRLAASRTFLAAAVQMRQLSLGAVDLALHVDFDPEHGGDPITFGQHVMEPFVLRPEFAHNLFLTSFSHIFSSGYAAGYYSYKWSEVLDADAFSRFQREGIFNPDTGKAFVDAVLSQGDSEDPMTLFRRFMGRDPDLDALIRRNLGVEPRPQEGVGAS
ncbi:MAG: M3 family metallopeptidase [Deinococcales bacterium]